MWEPRRLWAFTASYRKSFTFLLYMLRQGLNKTTKSSVMMASLRPEIRARNPPASSRTLDLSTVMLGGQFSFNPAKGHWNNIYRITYRWMWRTIRQKGQSLDCCPHQLTFKGSPLEKQSERPYMRDEPTTNPIKCHVILQPIVKTRSTRRCSRGIVQIAPTIPKIT
jgi:hypothetical protein